MRAATLVDMTVDFADKVRDYGSEHRLPAVAWAVVRDGKLAEHGVYNETDTPEGLAPPTHPVDIHTRFRIASMTKSFTAAAVLALRDDGLVDLDQPVTDIVPSLAGLRRVTDDAPAITLRLLLSMRSGLVTDDPWADRHLDLSHDELDQITGAGAIFAQPPATAFEYSNLGFALAGRVVEVATGSTVQQHVIERLLEPLGLTSTGWHTPADSWARPYRSVADQRDAELPPLGDGLMAPMGGLWSTIADLATWISWLDDAYPARDGDDDGPLRRSSRREMQSPQSWVGRRSFNGRQVPFSYGFGLGVLHDESLGTVISHSGGLPGYGSNMVWISGRRLGVVTLSNSTYAPMTPLSARLLEDLAADKPNLQTPEIGAEQRELGDALVGLLNSWVAGESDDPIDPTTVLADNCLDDRPLPNRIAAAAGIGPITIAGRRPINDATFAIDVTSPAGRRTIEVSPAPTLPWRVEHYTVSEPTGS